MKLDEIEVGKEYAVYGDRELGRYTTIIRVLVLAVAVRDPKGGPRSPKLVHVKRLGGFDRAGAPSPYASRAAGEGYVPSREVRELWPAMQERMKEAAAADADHAAAIAQSKALTRECMEALQRVGVPARRGHYYDDHELVELRDDAMRALIPLLAQLPAVERAKPHVLKSKAVSRG